MKRIIIMVLSVFVLFVVWLGESRKFIYLDNNKCITVWKTLNNVCYVIPEEYYGLWKPSKNYLKTNNTNEQLSIFITTELPDTIIFLSYEQIEVHDKNNSIFLNYHSDSSRLNSILYKNNARFFYKDLKTNADMIEINVLENYALGKNGKKF